MDEYLNIINHLELEIDPTNSDAVIISIAISLKRIADILERSTLEPDTLYNRIETAIWSGITSSLKK